MEGNTLYRNIAHRAGREDVATWKMCVPKALRETVLKENHDSPAASQVGSRKTIDRDARAHVRGCETCMRFKQNQIQMAGKMLTQVPEEPWATVCANFVAPLPRSQHGNQMLLVLLDRFSKWTELVPLRSATAESLKKAFRERIIARYGVPKIAITDNGVQFASKIFKSFLAEMGTSQQFTAPYTPQANPTERAIRTVKTMIAQFAGQN